MGNVLQDLFTGTALVLFTLIGAITLIPVLATLSVFLHVNGCFLSVALSILLFLSVRWGIGFPCRKVREAGGTQNGSPAP